MVLFSVIHAKHCFDVQKKMTKLPELEGYLIRKETCFFFNVFPYDFPAKYSNKVEILVFPLSRLRPLIPAWVQWNWGDRV